ncbi:PEPxxWA-CTERM sorting domain-containing protein [Sandarakinorhabdus sp.]|uniref:PEPxxWA-CTERM sorting domain-containing protein n=1 Tax=Sandarakinorhabdus sp. TaxID=1916663 RepID=UPI00286DA00E|nr:PEPxxWA-CTERM sorting domain-containing protein [Sandarakinorhabdus sp.]
MLVRAMAFGLAVIAAFPAQAVVIPGLINSGRLASNAAVTTGTVQEQNWFLGGSSRPWNSTTNNVGWLANNSVSRWMSPASNGNQSLDPTVDGFYTYSIAFDLGKFVPGTASFNGRFATDNTVTSILLNGTQITQAGLGTFNQWTNFSASTGFVGGLNTLSFRVRNFASPRGNPSGLRVEILGSAYEPVPEPTSWAMLIAGFGLVGAVLRRRRARLA